MQSCPLCQRFYSHGESCSSHSCNYVLNRLESSFHRHVKYCTRARSSGRGRPRSCDACNAAKTKCSFEKPCTRCEKKHISCVYRDHRTHAAPVSIPADVTGPTTTTTFIPTSDSQLQFDLFNPSFGTGFDLQPNKLTSLDVCESGNRQEFGIELLAGSQVTGVSLLDPDPDCGIKSTLMRLPPTNALTHHVTRSILQTLYALPQMMLRRETFPPFIHPHWDKPVLPEILANCVAIAQLFSTRTPATTPFLGRSLDHEDQRLRDECPAFSMSELQMGIQVTIIYTIMMLIDKDDVGMLRIRRMYATMIILAERFLSIQGKYASTESEEKSQTWEDWIFAESRRRIGCLCVIVSCISFIGYPSDCSHCGPLVNLPLPSSRLMWEARSQEQWSMEKAFSDLSNPVDRLGALMQMKRDYLNPVNAQRLQDFEIGSDRLTNMLCLIAEYVLPQQDPLFSLDI